MTIFSYGANGAEAITLVNNPAPDFRPLLDSEAFIDSSFFWAALPDDYDDLPGQDRRMVEAAWKAVIQYGAGTLAELAHLDQTSSIRDFPIRMQRRWQNVDFLRTVDAGGGAAELIDATLNSRNASLLRAPAQAQDTTLRLTPGNTHSGAYIELDGEVSSGAAVGAVLTLQLRGDYTTESPLDGPAAPAGEEQWFLLGYGDLSKERLAPGAYAALSTQRRLAAIVVRNDGSSRWAICSDLAPEDLFSSGIRLSVRSLAVDGGVRVYASAYGEGGDGGEARVSLYEHTSFVAKHLVMTSVDTRVPVDSPNEGEVVPSRQPFTATLGVVQYVDPTVHPGTRSIPVLQTRVSGAAERYLQSVDYDVVWDDIAGRAEIRWHRDFPAATLWAPVVALDGQLIEKIWGPATSSSAVSGADTERLRNLLSAVMYGLMGGPHPRPLSAAVGALSGAPMCVEDGVVVAVETDPDDPVIVVRGFDQDRRYYYPEGLRRTVNVGEAVTKLQMLCEVPVLRDWTSGEQLTSRLRLGHPFNALIRSEVEKFSALHIEIPAGAEGVSAEFEGSLSSLPSRLTEYLGDALSIWMGSFRLFLLLVQRLSDQVSLQDAGDFEGLLAIRTPLTNPRDPRYNDSAGYVYDGDLVYNEGERDILRGRLEVVAENTGGAPILVHIFGTDYTINPGLPSAITVPEYV